MIIYARSPYFINVALTAGYGSKIKLFLANGTASLPTDATYEIVKDYNQGTAASHDYNISNFIREYIENISYFTTTNRNFAKVKVETYRQNSDLSYTKLATLEFLGTNGYTLYTQGANYTDPHNECVLLGNTNIENYYHRDGGFTPRMGILVNSILGSKLEVTLTDLNGGNSVTTTLIATSTASTKAILEAVLSDITNAAYNKGNYCIIKYFTGATLTIDKTILVTPICEPKYTPVRCYYVNRFGGWQVLFFYKLQTNTINVSGTSYNMLADAVDYNTRLPQTTLFNVNGKQSVKLNTGWVPENYSELIQDLLLSETILLDDKPVQLRTQNTDLKTSLKDKNINYEIEFEYAYNLINNVV
jgi:hypothetical protein